MKINIDASKIKTFTKDVGTAIGFIGGLIMVGIISAKALWQNISLVLRMLYPLLSDVKWKMRSLRDSSSLDTFSKMRLS